MENEEETVLPDVGEEPVLPGEAEEVV